MTTSGTDQRPRWPEFPKGVVDEIEHYIRSQVPSNARLTFDRVTLVWDGAAAAHLLVRCELPGIGEWRFFVDPTEEDWGRRYACAEGALTLMGRELLKKA